ncbi:phenylalanine and histidine ammonia-lyase [Rostrohypoxylon terebratum]|nr:phenylalanine and histidine ammonia-lyase [Rostrohypoxylon terebratum]
MNHTDVVLDVWHRPDNSVSGEGQNNILLTGKTLTIADIVSIARHNTNTNIGADVFRSMESSFSILNERLQNGDIIYGVNTGFGGTADVRTKRVSELQQMLTRELHYGILPPGSRDYCGPLQESSLDSGIDAPYLPRHWARASIVVRINSLISNCSAVRPVVARRMQDLLTYDIIPMIPLRGSISASGDLSPLSYICGAIQGKSTIRILTRGSEDMYADMAFSYAGLEPVKLQAKEGLALTNGTAVSTAVAALALYDTHNLAAFAQVLTAMTVEALNGTAESFHPFFSDVRPHPGQIECARNILAFLEGSKLTKVNDGANSVLRQDRYSIRTAPQWIGPILEDLVLAHQQVSIECNSATDNPLVSPDGEVLHGGNFQAKAITSAMEKARQGIQGIGRMIFSQCTELINPTTNRGLTPNLVADNPSDSHIFKGTDLNIAALAAELGFLANPVNHVQTAEMGNQALNSLALISARYTSTANEVLSQLLAAHLIAVCQALDLRAMNRQFLDSYKFQFEQIITANYEMISTEHVDALARSLWVQLLLSFEATASMDAFERFGAVAKSLCPIVLDNERFNQDLDIVTRLQYFTEEVHSSLHNAWCANRDAYLMQGDATPILGRASRVVYTYLRQTLKVPMLGTKVLMTPTEDGLRSGSGPNGYQAPTVGSYTGTVHRALKDGTLMGVIVELLKTCV